MEQGIIPFLADRGGANESFARSNSSIEQMKSGSSTNDNPNGNADLIESACLISGALADKWIIALLESWTQSLKQDMLIYNELMTRRKLRDYFIKIQKSSDFIIKSMQNKQIEVF